MVCAILASTKVPPAAAMMSKSGVMTVAQPTPRRVARVSSVTFALLVNGSEE